MIGDVTWRFGQWYLSTSTGDVPILARTAGELARAKMDPYECLAALERAEQAMEIE